MVVAHKQRTLRSRNQSRICRRERDLVVWPRESRPSIEVILGELTSQIALDSILSSMYSTAEVGLLQVGEQYSMQG